MAEIQQLSFGLKRQTYAIRAVVTTPARSKPPQLKTIIPIPKSPHHTPHIIENDNGYITPVHRVISHQSNLWPHIIRPQTPQPRSIEKNYMLHLQGW